MPLATLANRTVEVDAEGFLMQPDQWDAHVAQQMAHDVGIGNLTDRHWGVIRFMRARYLQTGAAPSIRALGKESGVPVKELYQLSRRVRPNSPRSWAGYRNRADAFEADTEEAERLT